MMVSVLTLYFPLSLFIVSLGTGPVSVVVVPKYRAQFGWKPAERIPVSYPCTFVYRIDMRREKTMTKLTRSLQCLTGHVLRFRAMMTSELIQ